MHQQQPNPLPQQPNNEPQPVKEDPSPQAAPANVEPPVPQVAEAELISFD